MPEPAAEADAQLIEALALISRALVALGEDCLSRAVQCEDQARAAW
ncbi:MAG: hypothetical protein ACR2LF_13580 [Jatrophihabitantaceae bacterium]